MIKGVIVEYWNKTKTAFLVEWFYKNKTIDVNTVEMNAHNSGTTKKKTTPLVQGKKGKNE